MISHNTLADLSNDPVRKWDPSADFDREVIVFWWPVSLSDSFSSCPVYRKESPQNQIFSWKGSDQEEISQITIWKEEHQCQPLWQVPLSFKLSTILQWHHPLITSYKNKKVLTHWPERRASSFQPLAGNARRKKINLAESMNVGCVFFFLFWRERWSGLNGKRMTYQNLGYKVQTKAKLWSKRMVSARVLILLK